MDIGLACHLPPSVPNTWLDPNGVSVEEDVPMETGESANGAETMKRLENTVLV